MDILEEGKYAVMYDAGDFQALAKTMVRLVHDPSLLRKYQKLAYDRIHSKVFDRAEFCQNLASLLGEKTDIM